MSNSKNDPKGPGDFSVGYGRPPRHTQFRAGKSGNPKGRPKGRKTPDQALDDALARRTAVNVNGVQCTMGMWDVIMQGLVNDAAKRDNTARKLLFARIERLSKGPNATAGTLLPDDRAILEAYLRSVTGTREPAESNDSETSDEHVPEASTEEEPDDDAE